MKLPDEGIIRISLGVKLGQGFARIKNTRPLKLANRFSGKSPAEVAVLVPLVFSICRAAQAAACAEAIEAATGAVASPRTKAVRALSVLSETAREQALQVLHAWPGCMKAPEPAMAVASVRRLLSFDRELGRTLHNVNGIDGEKLAGLIAELSAILAEAVFGETVDDWLSRAEALEMGRWARRNETFAHTLFEYLIQTGAAEAGAAEIAPLPATDRSRLLAILLSEGADAFIAQPEWNGCPRETTPLGRLAGHTLVRSVRERYGPGLLARLAALLIELAEIPGKMRALAHEIEGASREERGPLRQGGTGIGIAEAARGRLVHAVEISGGVVRRYRILAPTEWNFHPKGATAKGLARIAMAAPVQREALARLFITAADPCVGYELRLPHA